MRRLRITAFSTCLILVFAIPTVWAQQTAQNDPNGPDPIVITRNGGKATIPEVDRDKVICFALYTLHNGQLKMSAQLYPLQEGESREVVLKTKTDGDWKVVQKQQIDETCWQATFKVSDWDDTKKTQYQLSHAGGATYEGVVRKNPIDKNEIVVAAFTGNSNRDRSMRTDIVQNIQAQDPDLLFFSGDQSYDHRNHLAAWLLFGRQFGEVIKDRPTVCIPDDHDVGQGNLWGEGGKKSTLGGGSDGGYTMPADYVNMVQKQQTWHLPDPYDSTKIEQDITVYYTSLNVGGIDFAIIEDRKWKTGPAGLIPQQGPRPDHINNPAYDRSTVDVPEARLLGKRQLKFLNAWGQDWDGVVMKSVLSQTIFAGGAHIHGGHKGRLLADLDSNGWPQSGRNRAIHEMRRCFAFHIAGDQHLATVIHHGSQSWEDSGVSFCVPSIVNYYGRWWWPLEDAQNHDPDSVLPFTGRYYDGLGNKVTMMAYANPTTENYNAAGYGIVRFNKTNRKIKMECWPRHVDVTKPDAKQMPGWPIEIDQLANYSRKPLAMLPTIKVTGAKDPVIQVKDNYLDEVVYTIRISGDTWQPPAFREASYSITVKGNGKSKSISAKALPAGKAQDAIEIDLR